MFARQLHELVRQFTGRIARRHRHGPRIGKLSHRLLLLFGEGALGDGGVLNGFRGCVGVGARRVCRCLGLTPADKDQTRLCLQNVFGQRAITFGLLGLAA